jgi:pyruvate dehydrogenase E2 component (dihydrolipoamide acetyltransferase)
MSSVRLNNADRLTLPEAAAIIREEIRKTRSGDESRTMRSGGGISAIPWPLRGWVFRLIRLITINLGIPLPGLGLPRNSFGSFLISNIGTLGLETGYPALFPVSDVAFVIIMGGVLKKPVVVDDKVVIRKMISLSIALDHRVVDAWHGGKLFRYIKYMVDHPALLETVPENI